MARVKGDKYNRKYCKQLKRGLRIDGMSIAEVCQSWGISRTCYNDWREKHPEFQDAHEHGERDCMAWWHKISREVAGGTRKGNAGVICFAMKNVEGIGWQDKVAVENSTVESVKQINISILPAPHPTKTLEDKSRIIEHEE